MDVMAQMGWGEALPGVINLNVSGGPIDLRVVGTVPQGGPDGPRWIVRATERGVRSGVRAQVQMVLDREGRDALMAALAVEPS